MRRRASECASCRLRIRPSTSRGLLVGARGFEPPTPCTPCRCATRLRYAPTEPRIISALALEHLEDALQFLAQRRRRDRLRYGHRALRVRLRGGTLAAGLFEPVARAVDGEAVLVEQLADAADQQHFVVLVIAAGGAGADWVASQLHPVAPSAANG